MGLYSRMQWRDAPFVKCDFLCPRFLAVICSPSSKQVTRHPPLSLSLGAHGLRHQHTQWEASGFQRHQKRFLPCWRSWAYSNPSLLEKVAGPNPILLLPPHIRNMTLSKLFYLWNTLCRCGRHLLIYLAERNIKGSFQKTRNSPDKGYTHYKRGNYSQMKKCPRLINVLSNTSIICGTGERIDHLSSFLLEIDIPVSFN